MGLEAAEGGGEKEEEGSDGEEEGGWEGEGWRGSDVTTEIKSNANTKLHYPSRTLTDPSSFPSCSHTPWHATPSVSPGSFTVPPFLSSSPLPRPTRSHRPTHESGAPSLPPPPESPHRSHPPPGNNPLDSGSRGERRIAGEPW